LYGSIKTRDAKVAVNMRRVSDGVPGESLSPPGFSRPPRSLWMANVNSHATPLASNPEAPLLLTRTSSEQPTPTSPARLGSGARLGPAGAGDAESRAARLRRASRRTLRPDGSSPPRNAAGAAEVGSSGAWGVCGGLVGGHGWWDSLHSVAHPGKRPEDVPTGRLYRLWWLLREFMRALLS
jgi:hypothetical protein